MIVLSQEGLSIFCDEEHNLYLGCVGVGEGVGLVDGSSEHSFLVFRVVLQWVELHVGAISFNRREYGLDETYSVYLFVWWNYYSGFGWLFGCGDGGW